jgi:hypothetical protein
MEDFPSHENLSNKSTRPIVIVSQLLQLVTSMHHIDELFTWLATTMVERFSMISVQIWAVQAYRTGGGRRKLRASTSRHPSQALQVLESAEVRVFVERMLREQRGILSIPVSSTFSHYQATIFAQQDCLYWTAYFLSNNVLLPPPQEQPEKEEVSTPLRMLFSFFSQKPLQPSHARAVSFLIEQSLRIAIGRGLLSHEPEKPVDGDKTKFGHLIPEHIQMGKIEQGDNPFTHAVVIPEKRSRQIYNLIDGKKNIQELMLLMQIDQKECLEILKILLLNGYIAVREISGDLVEVSTFSQRVKAEFK